MIESSIIVTVADQAVVRRALAAAVLPRRLLLVGAVVLSVALIVSCLFAASGDRVGVLVLGAIAALALLFAVLVVLARRVAARPVADALPEGSPLSVRAAAEGLSISGARGSSQTPWTSFSCAERNAGAVVFRDAVGKAAFVVPGRALSDTALVAIAGWIGMP